MKKFLALLLVMFATHLALSLERQPNADYRARREALAKKAKELADLISYLTATGPARKSE